MLALSLGFYICSSSHVLTSDKATLSLEKPAPMSWVCKSFRLHCDVFFYIFIFLFVCVCVFTRVQQCGCRDQKICRSQFSPSAGWIPGTRLRSSVLLLSHLTGPKFLLKKFQLLGRGGSWRDDGSFSESICCSCRGSRFKSQHPCLLTPVCNSKN